MAVEKFIAPKHDMAHHPSMRCHRTRFEASQSQLDVYNRGGDHNSYTPTELGDPPEVFRVEHGILFDLPEVKEMAEANRKPKA